MFNNSGIQGSLEFTWRPATPNAGLAEGPGISIKDNRISVAGVHNIEAGTNIVIDRTNPNIPIINAVGVSGIEAIGAGDGISVDNTFPEVPVINNAGVITIVAGTNVTVDNTDPQNPVVSATGGGGGAGGDSFRLGLSAQWLRPGLAPNTMIPMAPGLWTATTITGVNYDMPDGYLYNNVTEGTLDVANATFTVGRTGAYLFSYSSGTKEFISLQVNGNRYIHFPNQDVSGVAQPGSFPVYLEEGDVVLPTVSDSDGAGPVNAFEGPREGDDVGSYYLPSWYETWFSLAYLGGGGGGGGAVEAVVAGDGISVDNTDPANPVVSYDPVASLYPYITTSILEATYTELQAGSINILTPPVGREVQFLSAVCFVDDSVQFATGDRALRFQFNSLDENSFRFTDSFLTDLSAPTYPLRWPAEASNAPPPVPVDPGFTPIALLEAGTDYTAGSIKVQFTWLIGP